MLQNPNKMNKSGEVTVQYCAYIQYIFIKKNTLVQLVLRGSVGNSEFPKFVDEQTFWSLKSWGMKLFLKYCVTNF